MKQKKCILLFSILLMIVSIGPLKMLGKQNPQIRRIKKTPAVSTIRLIKPLRILKNELIGPLLKTNWGQRDEYAVFAPLENPETDKKFRLGCWSTAFAQILYYHRLQPYGTVKYKTSPDDKKIKPCSIKETLDHKFIWSKFRNVIRDDIKPYKETEVALYCYYTAVVVRKNFGTGSYSLKHQKRAKAIAAHYKTATFLYDTDRGNSLDEIKKIILDEIKKARPLMLHLRSKGRDKIDYHAVVIDGAGFFGKQFVIHINMGHKGVNNGWFHFKHIDNTYNDDDYRKIITVKPLLRRRVFENLLLLKTPGKYPLNKGEIIYHYPTSSGGWESRVGKPPCIMVSNLPRDLGESEFKSQ